MRALSILVLATVVAGCPPTSVSELSQPVASDARPDSIVLRRTLCFGTCPAYRLRLSRTGQIAFDDGEVKTDSVPAAVVLALVAYARELDLRSLPEVIDHGSDHCPNYATDHPSLHVSFYGSEPKQMRYYTGCYTSTEPHVASSAIQRLEAFAARMDTVTGATRWIRPGRR